VIGTAVVRGVLGVVDGGDVTWSARREPRAAVAGAARRGTPWRHIALKMLSRRASAARWLAA